MRSEKQYTCMGRVFEAIGGRQREYNWLLTALDCVPEREARRMRQKRNSPPIDEQPSMLEEAEKRCCQEGYCWMSGEELTRMIRQDGGQWIWGVLCGFQKDVPLAEVLKFPRPYAESYGGFWENPLTMQHPLAVMEIVAWDSTLTLFFTENKALADDFRRFFPHSRDLAAHNSR